MFLILCGMKYLSKGKETLDQHYDAGIDIGLVIFFPLILLVFAVLDTGKNLYDNDITETSLHLRYLNPDLYVLRNALLYVPMVVYFALRGLKSSEIRKIALLTVLIAPFSIFAFIYFFHLGTLTTFGAMVKLKGTGFQYNTYIPYLTFAALSAVYLCNAPTSNKLEKYIALAVLVFLIIYTYLSTSRQSILFILLSGFVFFVKNDALTLKKKLILLPVFLLCIWTIFKLITTDFSWESLTSFSAAHSISAKVDGSDYTDNSNIERFNQIDGANQIDYAFDKYRTLRTPRWEIMKHGLSLLQPQEYLTGAGLSSVINSGPHNDYIRWLQRIGILGMLFGFYPFVRALFSIAGLRNSLQNKKNKMIPLYLTLAILFTLYHSFFGYPREDAYQAVYCFLGLSMWLGVRKEYGLVSVMKPERKKLLSRLIYAR
ncbi:O-antigen ligase family protein [Legionella maioricensis]|uniref:O-antigen ligase family protein n=1 Tax=Legionella maioricensis TaxID=2896528 RepID=A0A9X2CZE7_9GAMM|nr:O-antigen ligase family protein [Legionella maioricensis]MCL9683551.1 O-antigen ligase family protein [Legionella maioricensis]MCL9686850.1 O-antigen ligase family protein [Legionella maioricensis]